MKRTNVKKRNKGITLIALVITIIVMLILVAVTINMAINGGLFNYAGKATGDTKNAVNAEKELANGKIQIDGVWYDSIDDYLNGEPSSSVKINLSIAGTKSNTVPMPTGFTYKEGTIDTGYVIQDSDGNEFVWVPVDKNQKITLKIDSEKDVKEVKLYDAYGDVILTIADNEIEKTYNNTNIEPTINGEYTAEVTTEDGKETKKIVVRSLYAMDTWADWYNSDEYVKQEGYSSKEEMYQDWANNNDYESMEAMFQDWTGDSSITTIEEFERYQSWLKEYEDLADYKASVNKNGGFFVARYEAGAPTKERTSGNSSDTVETIIAANGKPVSKQDQTPYNNVTFDQAKGVAEKMYDATGSNFKVGLLTDSAWDRTLGWIYETKAKTVKELAEDSTSWGNYKNAEFDITRGKYSTNWGSSYAEVTGSYKKANNDNVLLTTGAANRNAVNNIYDLAGNLWEWTNTAYGSYNRVFRGGLGDYGGDVTPAANRSDGSADTSGNNVGFRASIYLN